MQGRLPLVVPLHDRGTALEGEAASGCAGGGPPPHGAWTLSLRYPGAVGALPKLQSRQRWRGSQEGWIATNPRPPLAARARRGAGSLRGAPGGAHSPALGLFGVPSGGAHSPALGLFGVR